MTSTRLQAITRQYAGLRIAVLGDLCLDRYLEIDPAYAEHSIETGLPVHNVTRVRAQAGASGTILNNLAALGIGSLHPIGFCGVDGEGFELRQALNALPGVDTTHVLITPQRHTFTYCKPLVLERGQPPRELSRFDTKNWTPTPHALRQQLADAVLALAPRLDALVILDQVDLPDTGVVTAEVLTAVDAVRRGRPELIVIADSRRGLGGFPPVRFKMNRAELAALTGNASAATIDAVARQALTLARRNQQSVIVTLSEQGILGASPIGDTRHFPCLPIRGPIDIVGAGDAVTANLAAAFAAGADLPEALELANAAASIVIHQLGTTGTASVAQLEQACLHHPPQPNTPAPTSQP